jgi:hypothetical protein
LKPNEIKLKNRATARLIDMRSENIRKMDENRKQNFTPALILNNWIAFNQQQKKYQPN